MTGQIPMEFPTHEEIIEASGDKKGGWWDGEAMSAWGIPTKNTPRGWVDALRKKDEKFFRDHGIHVRRRPKPISIEDDDLFIWG